MKMKQNMPGRVCPRHALRSSGVSLALLFLAISCPPAHAIGPYSAAGSTVLDQGTGLEWQKSDDATPRTWQEALAYCENLSIDSKTDWRLPNIRELKSLVDVSRYYPAIDPALPCQLSSYWSATTVADSPAANGWIVFFANGDDNWDVKSNAYYVRCVRTGIEPSPR